MLDFDFLIRAVKATYSSRFGVIAQLRNRKRSRPPYSLCVSTIRNAGMIVPAFCVLWDDNILMFQGKLNSKTLRRKVDELQICCLELTNAHDLEALGGDRLCFGEFQECDNQRCKKRAISADKLPEKYLALLRVKKGDGDAGLDAIRKWKAKMTKIKNELKKGGNCVCEKIS